MLENLVEKIQLKIQKFIPYQLSDMAIITSLCHITHVDHYYIFLCHILNKCYLLYIVDSGILKHRQVKHFGFEFRYGINNVDPNNPLAEGIPEICNGFLQKAISMNYVSHFPDQLTVNHYLPGQGKC